MPDCEQVDDVEAIPHRRSPWFISSSLLAVVTILTTLVTRYGTRLVDHPATDEYLSIWVVSGDIGDAITRSWDFQGQSPAYFVLLWIWSQIVGSAPFLLRLPSVAALFGALWHINRLGRDLVSRSAGHVAAALTMVILVPVVVDARPYALLLLLIAVSTRLSHSWSSQTTASTRTAIAWGVTSGLVLAMQPLALWALVPQLVWVRSVWARGHRRDVGVALASGGAVVSTFVLQVISLARRSDELVLVDAPDIGEIASAMVPTPLALAIFVAVVVSVGARPMLSAHRPGVEIEIFAALWFVSMPLGLLLQGWLTGSPVFVERYLVAGSPGVALAGALVIDRFTGNGVPAIGRNLAASAACVALAMYVTYAGPYRVVGADFADAAQIATEAHESGAEIWAYTGYIEANDVVFFERDGAPEYLAAPLRAEGFDGSVTPLPRRIDRLSNERYVAQLLASEIRSPEDIVVLAAMSDVNHHDEIARMLTTHGYQRTTPTRVGRVWVSRFSLTSE